MFYVCLLKSLDFVNYPRDQEEKKQNIKFHVSKPKLSLNFFLPGMPIKSIKLIKNKL